MFITVGKMTEIFDQLGIADKKHSLVSALAQRTF